MLAEPSTTLFLIGDFDELIVEVPLTEEMVGHVAEGTPVEVGAQSLEEPIRATVSRISPFLEAGSFSTTGEIDLANPDGRLRPGMFVTVEAVSPERRKVLAIPATAVIFAPYGDSVFVIEEKKDDAGKASTTVRQKFVRTGERRGDFVAVESGLEAGERIVSGGAFKLRNGMAVVVNDALAPKPELAPKPAEP
jgi:membrane fusion protein (multidrug efflux system)